MLLIWGAYDLLLRCPARCQYVVECCLDCLVVILVLLVVAGRELCNCAARRYKQG